MTLRARTHGPDATRSLAAALAEHVAPGDVLLLAGELGAGKTAFVQGLAAGLGIDEQVTSPTFTLARHYEGRLPLHHVDVYRLERLSELSDIGVAELLDTGGVIAIEWGDAVAAALPNEHLEIRFTYGDADDDRELEFRFTGSRWAARERVVTESIASWKVHG